MGRLTLLLSLLVISSAAALTAAQPPSGTRGQPELLIIPRPKSLQLSPGEFRFPGEAAWSLKAPAAARTTVEPSRAILEEATGRRLAPLRSISGNQGELLLLRIGGGTPSPPPATADAEWARSAEGYRLEVAPEAITLAAPTPAGIVHGVRTLAQMVLRGDAGAAAPAAVVTDWPSLPFRGGHFFPSAPGVPFHRKLVERVLGPLKLNHAVLECQAARWDSHPEIAAPGSIGKRELRDLVELSRRHGIEPIPLIDCPGHAGWVFRNGQNLELCEDPRALYAYCVSHPGSDRFVKEILGEALEVFRPKHLHLGHDELHYRGRFPNPDCPRCRGKRTTELLTEHSRRLGAWLQERGVQPMLWGDMFLADAEGVREANAPSAVEARSRRQGLLPGTVVADWHYGTAERYPSLRLFQEAGLDTIASTWSRPENIYRFSQAALAASRSTTGGRCRGLLQTTWVGHFPDERVLGGKELRQFEAIVLAAEYAWSGRADPPRKLGYRPGEVFRRLYYGAASGQPSSGAGTGS